MAGHAGQPLLVRIGLEVVGDLVRHADEFPVVHAALSRPPFSWIEAVSTIMMPPPASPASPIPACSAPRSARALGAAPATRKGAPSTAASAPTHTLIPPDTSIN